MLDSKGAEGLSEKYVIREHVRIFGRTVDFIFALIEEAVRSHQIVRHNDDKEGKWLVSVEYAPVYRAIPWIASKDRCNLTFNALLHAKVLSILSKGPGSTIAVIHRELHVLSMHHTALLLTEMEAQCLIVSAQVKRRLLISLFQSSCTRDEHDIVYHIK